MVVNGSQQALDLTARILLDPGDGVVIEEPHYLGARQALSLLAPVSLPCLSMRKGSTSPCCQILQQGHGWPM
jgi:DNA-binding transcriptional MocR family regulator